MSTGGATCCALVYAWPQRRRHNPWPADTNWAENRASNNRNHLSNKFDYHLQLLVAMDDGHAVCPSLQGLLGPFLTPPGGRFSAWMQFRLTLGWSKSSNSILTFQIQAKPFFFILKNPYLKKNISWSKFFSSFWNFQKKCIFLFPKTCKKSKIKFFFKRSKYLIKHPFQMLVFISKLKK